LALKEDQQQKEKEKEKENKRHTMSHPPDHIPELDSPHQSRSPIKKDKKERVSKVLIYFSNQTISSGENKSCCASGFRGLLPVIFPSSYFYQQ
jgi:hypothetical protein